MSQFEEARRSSIGFRVGRIFRMVGCLLEREVEKLGLSFGQIPYILTTVDKEGQTQDEIAAQLHVNRAATARTLKSMEKAGFVTREENPKNRRQNLVRPTEKAEGVARELLDVLNENNTRLFTGFSNDDKEQLLGLLDQVIANAEIMLREGGAMFKADERTAGLYTITVSQFALVFMLSAVAVAVPALGLEFSASASRLGLVESGYISAVAMFLFPVTRLADKFGRGATFAGGVLLFAVVSLLLPLTATIDQFVALRVIQGGGGAMMASTGLALLADMYDGVGRAKAFGVATAGVYLGLSAGPWLGGMIVTHLGWHWIFYGGAIPCLISFFISLKTLPVRPVIARSVRFDWGGAILSALGMMLLSQGGSHLDDLSGQTMLGVGLVFLVAFVLWENHAKAPLLDMTIFAANPAFSLGSLVLFISYAATFGITFMLSLYLQLVRGMTASEAGVILMAQPLLQVLFSLVSGSMCERWPAHNVSTIGMAAATIALGGAIFLGHDASLLHILAVLALCGAGSAVFGTANSTVIMGAVRKEYYGVASAVVGAARTTGMTVSLVFISGIFALIIGPGQFSAGQADVFMQAMEISLILLTVCCGLGTVLSLRARDRRE